MTTYKPLTCASCQHAKSLGQKVGALHRDVRCAIFGAIGAARYLKYCERAERIVGADEHET